MQDQINNIKEKVTALIKNAVHSKELEEIRINFLGKKGEFTTLLKSLF